MRALLLLLPLLACICVAAEKSNIPVRSTDPVHVHVVCHTHDDVGWLKTVDQYYAGQNNSIQHAGVQYILDSVIPMLVQNPKRKFIYVEIAFFERWWNEQSDDMQTTVKGLVANGQIEFINGGMCMNDEATTHYVDIVDQMSLGHSFLKDTFGVTPRIGWHIDPFGHSSVQATLFAQMGFDGFFFGRADYADKQNRLNKKTMEVIWRGSPSLGAAEELFTGLNFNGYGPPDGFCWDQGCDDEPIQNDPRLFDVNIVSRAADFAKWCLWQASYFNSNNIMLTMGSDFQYENANLWYKNLDKLLDYLADHPELGLDAFYSTPSIYLDAVHGANLTWTVKTDDYFPYADGPHAFWTGYFVSRPGVKGYVRDMSSYLQTCRHFEVLSKPANLSSAYMSQAMGVAQHHDAVSGTEKQHVAYDYAKRISIGAAECSALINDAIAQLVTKSDDAPVFVQCPLANQSICDATASLGAGGGVAIVVYNPIQKPRVAYLRVPVPSENFHILDSSAQSVPSQIVSNTVPFADAQPYTLVFPASLPALGFQTYFMTSTQTNDNKHKHKHNNNKKKRKKTNPVAPLATSISNAFLQIDFDSTTGHITTITDKVSGLTTAVDQSILWYNSSNAGTPDDGQTSGAYIFRPNSSTAFPVSADGTAKLTVTEGDLVVEAVQQFASWAIQTVRLYADLPFVEVEYQIGPIPIDDGFGKEIITRWDTDIATASTWYTDANGREMRKRVRDYRPDWTYNATEPIAGNYYPLNSGAYIEDEAGARRLTLLTDRSQAAASIKDGSLEAMIHRRILHDDYRGVGEPLSEPGLDGNGLIIRTRHLMIFNSSASSDLHRQLEEELTYRVLPAFTPVSAADVSQYIQDHNTAFSFAAQALPPQLHLLTLQTWKDGTLLLRLAHQFETGEGDLGVAATVDLASLFDSPAISVASAVELNLSANQNLSDVHRLQWNTNSDDNTTGLHRHPMRQFRRKNGKRAIEVTINPMEIRTFALTLQ